VIECDPVVVNVYESVAVPELSVPFPIELEPSLNATDPVAAEGETVAVNVTLTP
jgi:hypothetical protein